MAIQPKVNNASTNIFSPDYWKQVGETTAKSWQSLWPKPNTTPVAPPATKHTNFINGNGSKGPSSNILDNPAFGKTVVGSSHTQPYGGLPSGGGAQDGDSRMSLAEALAQMQSLLGASGVQNGGVSYDPLRQQARSQWSDTDARTKAMYDQLQAGIGAESGNIDKVFDAGIADTNQATQFATDQQNASQKSLTDMQTQQAQALGIEEAVANNINTGNNAADDAAAHQAANAARGQITSNQLTNNRTTAQTGISNLVGAAGLQGAMSRVTRQNELARLLAQYDVDESKANQESSSNYQSQLMGGVFDLLGLDRKDFAQDSENQYHAQSESNDYDIATMPKATNGPAPMDAASARQSVINTLGRPDAFTNANTRDAAIKMYLQLQGY